MSETTYVLYESNLSTDHKALIFKPLKVVAFKMASTVHKTQYYYFIILNQLIKPINQINQFSFISYFLKLLANSIFSLIFLIS